MSQIRVRMRLLNTKCLRERVTVQLGLFMKSLKNTKGVIRSRKSKMDRQYRQKKKNKTTNNDQQKTTQRIKNRTARKQLKVGSELMCSLMMLAILIEKQYIPSICVVSAGDQIDDCLSSRHSH